LIDKSARDIYYREIAKHKNLQKKCFNKNLRTSETLWGSFFGVLELRDFRDLRI
jgi:hypothetical protein